MKRCSISVNGIVQGVGFRPFVVINAKNNDLTGFVFNHDSGVEIEVQGEQKNIEHFLIAIKHPPPLAKITTISYDKIKPLVDEDDFKVKESVNNNGYTQLPADSAICDACLNDLFNPSTRFYHYPFVSCTHCGPRLSTTIRLPYDRDKTTFSPFKLCRDCLADYNDIKDRRYHAQTIACLQCGPKLSHKVIEIAQKIKQGEIVALKGLSGFHFVVDALNTDAIKRLRELKNRDYKPFALMALNTNSIKQHAYVNDKEKQCLSSIERPIVLLDKKQHILPELIAPGLNQLGFMLPYTPLHYLLFYYLTNNPTDNWLKEPNINILIMTSSNYTNEDMIINENHPHLTEVADTIVWHDRVITLGIDDSVIRAKNTKTILLRRGRGFTPHPI
jgi:hydrogenase maturation protein HypF